MMYSAVIYFTMMGIMAFLGFIFGYLAGKDSNNHDDTDL